jgi:hypothetical protein
MPFGWLPGTVRGTVHVVPKWLPQFLVPLLLVLVVVLAGLTLPLGALAFPVILVIALVGLAVWRVQYLKRHPPDPELVTKPFWKL